MVLNYAGLYCEESWSPAWGHVYVSNTTLNKNFVIQRGAIVVQDLRPYLRQCFNCHVLSPSALFLRIEAAFASEASSEIVRCQGCWYVIFTSQQ